VFYINLPIGAVALVVIAAALPITGQRGHHIIDFLGTVLLAAAATILVLLTTLGGSAYPWASAPIYILAVAGVILIIGFLFAERRAAEPVLPLELFRNTVFSLACAIGFIVGFALFGATTFLPLFLQVVNGASPTISGLRLLPMILGLLITSIASGQLITRWGRYKVFPIVGTALMVLGMFLLSLMSEHTSVLVSSLCIFVLGLGLGLVMQVLVIAVQNAVDYRNLGAATSGATFFRSIGGSFGTAIFGAIFSNLLASHLSSLASSLPSGFTTGSAGNAVAIQHLPAALRAEFVHVYAQSLSAEFLVAAPFCALAFLLTWFLPEVRLRTTTQATDVGHTFAMPMARSSQEEIERALQVLASRESLDQIYRRLATRAGMDLDPRSTWLLFRLQEQSPISQKGLATRLQVPVDQLTSSIEALLEKGLVTTTAVTDGQAGDRLQLTAAGQETAGKLETAYHDSLAELLDGWSPEQEEELASLLRRVATTLFSEENKKELISSPAL
jgi:DNA-binding MarR family transcriptional regulator